MANTPHLAWETYVKSECVALVPILHKLGITLSETQPHVGGERYLMQAVTTTSGKKLVLLGVRDSDGAKVVVKVGSDRAGIQELRDEHARRTLLQKIRFAYGTFRLPEELLYLEQRGRAIAVQHFIEQERPFTERTLREQFSLALTAFKAQESAHATTYGHERTIAKVFGKTDASYYLEQHKIFTEALTADIDPRLPSLMQTTHETLLADIERIEQYCGFLAHTDFVPHNFRVIENDIYLLDTSSLRFGNKYEGWARFLNFMTLYNPELEALLTDYVRQNRTPEESEALYLMRLYRLGEIIWYYANTLPRTAGHLRELNEERIRFWTSVLESLVNSTPLPETVLNYYRAKRDRLRSPEEKRRQQGLH